MSELVLIFPAPTAAARAALAQPLGRARESALPGGDWRSWLARRLGAAALATQPPAQVAAAAAGLVPADAWFATPVALIAALDHVRMPADGWLMLTADEGARLAADFARGFDGSGVSLLPAGAEGFLLSGLAAPAARTHDPAGLLGADIGPWLASGEGAAAVRRLGAEIELWLHGHPVNRARAQRGCAPVATLWLWGGGAPPAKAAQAAPVHPGGPVARLYGGDSWLRGVWRAAGRELAGDAQAMAQVCVAGDADTIVVARHGIDEGIVERWCGPALAQLAGRRIRRVRFVLDGRQFRCARFDLVKPWRRTVSWAMPA